MTTIHVIDDNLALAEEIRHLLESGENIVRVYSDGEQFFNPLRLDPKDIIILDMRLPGMSGLEICNELFRRKVKAQVIFLSGQSYQNEIIAAMRLPHVNFLLKPFEIEELLNAVREALDQAAARAADEEAAALCAQSKRVFSEKFSLLTPKENQIFGLIEQGLSNAEIAKTLGMKTDTVKKHRHAIFEKFEVENFAELLKKIKSKEAVRFENA